MMDDSGSASGREESPLPVTATTEEQALSRAPLSLDDVTLPQVKAVANDNGGLIPTDNPHVLCTPLPLHCRVNSPIHIPFVVVATTHVPDGTLVRLAANNKFNPTADLKNAEALMTNQMAKFPDIRFVGRSGRGRRLNVHIEIQSDPQILAVYENAIKVTADGPREPRRHNSRYAPYNPSDSWQQQRLSPSEEGKEWGHPGVNTLIAVESDQDTHHMVTQQSPHSVDSGTEEDVPMNTDPSSMAHSGLYNTVKTYSAMHLDPTKHVASRNSLMSSPGKDATTFLALHRGVNGTNVHHPSLTVEALSEGSNSPLSPNVQKSPISQLMQHRVFYLPSSPTVVSPPGSATLPSQASTTMQSATSGDTTKPQGGAPNVTVATQLFSLPQPGGQQTLLQPVLFQPSLNSSPATSQAILMPISPRNAQKGQQLVQFPFVQNATQAPISSPSATSAGNSESENALDSAQNVKYLKGLDHKTILKLLVNMGLERYQQMFIKEHVDGELLSSMSELDLEELGIQSSLHKKRFVKLVEGKHSAKDYLEKGNPYHTNPHDSS